MAPTETQRWRGSDSERLIQIVEALGRVQLELDRERIDRLEVDALFDEVLAAMSEAVLIADPRGRITRANEAAVTLLGVDRESLIDVPVQQVLGSELASSPWKILETNPTGQLKVEARLPTRAGSARVSLSSAVVRDAHGKIVATVFVARDLSETERLLYDLEHAQHRLLFVAQAGVTLASSLDVASSLGVLARMAVPAIADAFAVCFTFEDRDRVIAEHIDQGAVDVLRDSHAAAVLREAPVASIHEALGPAAVEPVSRLLGAAGMASGVIAPMTLHGKRLGGLLIAVGAERERYGEAHRRLAEDLAHRATLSIENARLYADQLHVARVLQQSLLPTTLPKADGLDVAAIYRPGAQGLLVGGDFYDFFEAQDGWVAVIGDVCGKGVEAAALTALSRYTVRAAVLKMRQPRRILDLLNHAIRHQQVDDRFCTVALARLEQTGEGVRMTVATGGHPPPIVIRAGGAIEPLDLQGALLGVLDDPTLAERRILLQGGDTVVLYTDGITEAPTERGQFGEEGVLDALRSTRGCSAAETVATLEDAVDSRRSGAPDDMAIFAIQVTS